MEGGKATRKQDYTTQELNPKYQVCLHNVGEKVNTEEHTVLCICTQESLCPRTGPDKNTSNLKKGKDYKQKILGSVRRERNQSRRL